MFADSPEVVRVNRAGDPAVLVYEVDEAREGLFGEGDIFVGLGDKGVAVGGGGNEGEAGGVFKRVLLEVVLESPARLLAPPGGIEDLVGPLAQVCDFGSHVVRILGL